VGALSAVLKTSRDDFGTISSRDDKEPKTQISFGVTRLCRNQKILSAGFLFATTRELALCFVAVVRVATVFISHDHLGIHHTVNGSSVRITCQIAPMETSQ
jgi:hypothetical protein